MGQQRRFLARLTRKHNQTCVCNGAVNPHRKFRMRKNVLVPMVKFQNLNFICLNLAEIKTIFQKIGFFINYNYLLNVPSEKLYKNTDYIDPSAI